LSKTTFRHKVSVECHTVDEVVAYVTPSTSYGLSTRFDRCFSFNVFTYLSTVAFAEIHSTFLTREFSSPRRSVIVVLYSQDEVIWTFRSINKRRQ